jgi:hypothetical protein
MQKYYENEKNNQQNEPSRIKYLYSIKINETKTLQFWFLFDLVNIYFFHNKIL